MRISFPVKCKYRGGSEQLGRHGRRFRIEDGKMGYGILRLTHSIPLTTVSSVEVTERQVGGAGAQTLVAFGVQPSITKRAAAPKQVTDITVRTRDGGQARWTVEQRSADWVRQRLTPVLQHARIPYYDQLPPRAREGS